jgi:Fe-S cluster assembly protein SufD
MTQKSNCDMFEVMQEKDIYLASFAQFEKTVAEQGPAWLHGIRSAAIDRFAELGFPTLRDEEWRFTNLAPLTKVPFQLAGDRQLSNSTVAKLRGFMDEAGPSSRLVFVNGWFDPKLSSLLPLPDGVTVGSLVAVCREHPDWVEPYLARYADFDEQPFTALNTAFIQDGAFISLPRGKVVDEPIHLVFVSTTAGRPTVSHPRNLILAGINSQAAIVESYLGVDDDVYFTNVVTEVVAGENAVLDHYKIQRESRAAFHFATLQVYLGRSSNFTNHAISLGGALVRNDVNAVLDADGGECTLNGLYLAAGRQHIDNHTRIDHARPHCASHELYKGILDGNAHGVFNGKIYVHQDAQKTDAKQTNKTLLLSPNAVIDTKPQLEIFADDVKCTHGATIGQLADEAIFYLRSRGLGRDDARSLLTFAFANDVIGRIKVEPIRARLEQALLTTLGLQAGASAREVAP